MVEPKQYQLEELDGDCTGPGDSNAVISLTGYEGAVDANGNRITNVATPIDGYDAANKDYVDGVVTAPSLADVLAVGNATGVNNIEISNGTTIVAGAPSTTVTVNDNLTVNGKLTVTGLIDPTGLILTPQASGVGTNALWMKTGTNTSFLFTNSNSTDVFEAGEDATSPFIGIGPSHGITGMLRLSDDNYVVSNNKYLVGYDSTNTTVAIGDNGLGSGRTITLYSQDDVVISDPDGGSPKSKFTFDVTTGELEFDNSNTGAGITYESAVGGTNTFTITAQDSTSATGGALTLNAGRCLGGSGDGGGINLVTGTTVSGSGGTLTMVASAGTSTGGGVNLVSGGATTGPAGVINITGGNGYTNGGHLNVSGGDATTGVGGALNLRSGDGYSAGGWADLEAGDASDGSGGSCNIYAGNGTNSWGGHVNISAGNCTGGIVEGGNANLEAGDGNPGGNVELQSGSEIGVGANRGYIRTRCGSEQVTKISHAQTIGPYGGSFGIVIDWTRHFPQVDGPGYGIWRYVDGGRVVMTGIAGGTFRMYDLWPAS